MFVVISVFLRIEIAKVSLLLMPNVKVLIGRSLKGIRADNTLVSTYANTRIIYTSDLAVSNLIVPISVIIGVAIKITNKIDKVEERITSVEKRLEGRINLLDALVCPDQQTQNPYV